MVPTDVLQDQNPWWRDGAVRRARGYPVRRDLEPEILRRVLEVDDWQAKAKIGRNGKLIFEVPLAGLNWERPRQEREIASLALIEFPISAFRLAKMIYADVLRPDDEVRADLRFLGIRGWILRGGPPSQIVVLNNPRSYDRSDDLLPVEPFCFNFGEIGANPDACGYRMVRWVYDAFGFSESAIPDCFDRVSQRLLLE
jgi:hypothetical protein